MFFSPFFCFCFLFLWHYDFLFFLVHFSFFLIEEAILCRNLKPIYRNSVLDPALAHSMMEYCPKLFMR